MPFSGSTPTISPSSNRVMVSDDNGNVIALNKDLNELWRVDVGKHQVAASIAVSPDNNELICVTKFDIFKIIDKGDHGEIAWKADLDAFPGFINFNALTPTITANGIAVSVGAGHQIKNDQVMMKVGMGLLDRDTGKLRNFTEGREDSIAVTSIGTDGGYYTASSPVRRAVARGLLGDHVPEISGGIQRYKPIRLDLLVRDATCAAAARGLNTDKISAEHPQSAKEDILQIEALINQSKNALPKAVERGEMDGEIQTKISGLLADEKNNLSIKDLTEANKSLSEICEMFE
jgi:hypothetical protein